MEVNSSLLNGSELKLLDPLPVHVLLNVGDGLVHIRWLLDDDVLDLLHVVLVEVLGNILWISQLGTIDIQMNVICHPFALDRCLDVSPPCLGIRISVAKLPLDP